MRKLRWALATAVVLVACKDDGAKRSDPAPPPQVRMTVVLNGETVNVAHATLVTDSEAKLRLFLTPEPIDCASWDPGVTAQDEVEIALEKQPGDAGAPRWLVANYRRVVISAKGFTSSGNNYAGGKGNVTVGPSQGGLTPIGINFEHDDMGYSATIQGGVNAKSCPNTPR